MYGIDSGNGYTYGEDETSSPAGEYDEKAAELSMDNPAPSGASPDNL